MKRIVHWLSMGILFIGFFVALEAHAASVTFTSPVGLLVTSPATTFTIATNSVADLVTLNATSVMVSLSGGEAFTLLSPASDLAIATSSNGSSVTDTCTSGLVTAALSETTGSTVYTITPSGTSCANASPPIISTIAATNITNNSATISWITNVAADSIMSYGASVSYGATSTDATLRTSHSITLVNLSPDISYHFIVTSSENGTSTTSSDNTFTTAAATSGGGGGGEGSVGVAAGYGSPAATLATPLSTAVSASSTSVESASTASLIAEIASLEAELVTLQAEANGSTPSSASFSYVFTRNLSYGMTGNDVKELQLFLISEDKEPAARKLAAHGTTKNFAILTLAALIEFQKNAGIHPASGYFGPVTRAYVKNLEKNSSTPNQL